MKRRTMILLVASLVVNVFLIGLIGGTVWHWTHDRGMGFRGGWRMRVAESLPQPQRQLLRQAIHDTVRQALPRLRQSGAARAEAARLFVQPQFDANAINAKLDQARASDMQLRTDLEHRMIQFAATLPQDQRTKMAEALKEGPFRQGPPHPHGQPPSQ
ncbi:MAG: periplasmic heavy metal sensor [Sphingomonas sp.]|nr:periplasmic heavy metal sensor [Sphingomonas sp.]MBW8834364.1 periplasmic heavy metal sensor [Burkholderia sp.]